MLFSWPLVAIRIYWRSKASDNESSFRCI